ncbi:ABC transporter ATP-binding protein [Klebsiella pneumoniae]|nr:ABC transporter ATP-binding protein [Klebsiella pneumoniae]
MSYLQISGLKISYGDKVVLHNIDLAVEQCSSHILMSLLTHLVMSLFLA